MNVVAKIRIVVPNRDTFVVRGSVPMPEGYQYSDLVSSPLKMLDSEGNPVDTQWSMISRYPNGDVASAMFAATVSRHDLSVYEEAEFELVEDNNNSVFPNVPVDLAGIVLSGGQFKLRTRDLYDNEYIYDIMPKVPDQYVSMKAYDFGPAHTTVAFSHYFKPSSVNSTNLPHFGGVQAWMKLQNDTSRVFELTLNWHNGFGHAPADDLYFKSLEILVPKDFDVKSEWPEPMMGNSYEEGDFTVVPLVMEDWAGKMHLLPQRAERCWRLYIHEKDNQHVSDCMNQYGWGTCVPEGDLWSWNNKNTANWFIQRAGMPIMDRDLVDNKLSKELNDQREELLFGSGWDGQGLGQMGMFNPAGIPYGGGTGGNEIHMWDGVEAVNTSRPDGLLLHRVKHRRYTDRAFAAIYTARNNPIVLDNLLSEDGSTPWLAYNNQFINESWPNGHLQRDHPFNFDEADDTQVKLVKSELLQPDYEVDLRRYQPIDHQHERRRTKDLITLIWLDNDPLAKMHLKMQRELDRMTFFEGTKGRYEDLLKSAKKYKNKGGDFGRGNAWVLDTIVSSYAVGTNEERARFKPWIDTNFEILYNMQMPNGGWQRKFANKIITDPPFGGEYSVMQPYEMYYTTHAVRGLSRSVYEGVDLSKFEVCEDMIFKAAVGTWTYFWGWKQDMSGPLLNSPWNRVAVGSLNPADDVWVNHSQHPPEQWNDPLNPSDWQSASILSYGYDRVKGLPQEPLVFTVLQAYAFGNDPKTFLKNQGLKQIDGRAFLLYLLED